MAAHVGLILTDYADDTLSIGFDEESSTADFQVNEDRIVQLDPGQVKTLISFLQGGHHDLVPKG